MQWLSIIRFSAKDQSRLHHFGKKVLPGMFLGYASIAMGIWKGVILVAAIGELEKMDASENYPRRINAKEVLTPQREETFRVHGCRWHSKIVRKRRRIPRTHSEAGTTCGSEDLSEELRGEPEGPQQTQSKDDAEARNDFWSIEGDFVFLVITMNLEFNRPSLSQKLWCFLCGDSVPWGWMLA